MDTENSALLELIDPAKISASYAAKIEKGDGAGALAALADHFRHRPACPLKKFTGVGRYDREAADNACRGIIETVGIVHDFGGVHIDFLHNPTESAPPVNHEWLWQTNRHGFWEDMACAYKETGDERYAEAFDIQLSDWLHKVPCPEGYNGPGSAWRTIECGIRLLGPWQTVFEVFRHSASLTDEALLGMVLSMHRQAVFLTEHFTGHNWLLMEAVGAFTFAVLFPEFSDSGMVMNRSAERLTEELPKQFMPDGFHNELSPDYFIVSYGCYYNMFELASSCGVADRLPEKLIGQLRESALTAIRLSTPHFTLPRTNDCYTIPTRSFTEKAARVFPENEEFRYVNSNRREGNPLHEGKTASCFLPYAGLCIMRSGWEEDAAYLCFDVGPLGMAHIHEDMLNIHLYKGGDELLFDDGGGQYEISDYRAYALSSYDHNTVTVDGMPQTRTFPKSVDSPIDCGWVTSESFDYACGVYDGTFGEGQHPAVHKREVRFCKPGFFAVIDTLTSADGAPHDYTALFHLDTENLSPADGFPGGVRSHMDGTHDLLLVPLDEGTETAVVSGSDTWPLYGWYVGRNDKDRHKASTVLRTAGKAQNHRFVTLLFPLKKDTPYPSVEKTAADTFTVSFDGTTYSLDVAHPGT